MNILNIMTGHTIWPFLLVSICIVLAISGIVREREIEHKMKHEHNHSK